MSTHNKNSHPNRVLCGGSWSDCGPSWVRAASRDTYEPADRNILIGFRCALPARQSRA